MDSSKLGRLQRAVLDQFFAAAPEAWFLTGGAALAGFWLGHRTTSDLRSADPATVAWVLSTSELPTGTDRAELLAYRAWLESGLRRRAIPD